MTTKFKTDSWRKTAIAIYGPPKDGKVYGTYEIDALPLLNFIKKKKEKGIHLTVTNIVTAALARTVYYDVPELNCFVRRGKLVQRDNVDVFLAVSQKGENVTGMIIRNAEQMTVTEIAEYQRKKLDKIYAGKKKSYGIQHSIANIPWPFRGLVIRFIKWWIFQNGFRIPFVKLNSDSFGSISLSNIGVFGLTTGYLALFPIANFPAVITMGQIKEKPIVVKSKIVIRPMLPISGTFDHRVVEGDKIGMLKNGAEKRLLHPELLDSSEKRK